MVSLRNLLLAMVAGVVLLVCLVWKLSSMQGGSRTGYSCVVCRKYRTETTLFGIRRRAEMENDCSRWYREHVERDHDHVWNRGTCETLLTGLGRPYAFSCSFADYSFHQISSSTQMRVYQHFKDPMKAKQLFVNLADERTASERFDKGDESKVTLTLQSLEEWETAGFPDTWEVWWDRWWTLHLADHKERLAWIDSKSQLLFSVWKERRKRNPAAD